MRCWLCGYVYRESGVTKYSSTLYEKTRLEQTMLLKTSSSQGVWQFHLFFVYNRHEPFDTGIGRADYWGR